MIHRQLQKSQMNSVCQRMMTKSILRNVTSSSLNPFSEAKYFSVRNGNLGAISYFFSTGTAVTEQSEGLALLSSLSAVRSFLKQFREGANHKNIFAANPKNPRYSVSKETMFRTLTDAINPKNPTPKEPIPQILKQWVYEGRKVDIHGVRQIIKQFRKFRRYNDALEISEWSCSNNLNRPSGDAAIHLDLIYKVHGLEQVERYFDSMPSYSKLNPTYGVLLNCYIQEKLMDKAEAIMDRMRDFGYGSTLSYNGMLNLYSQMGKWIKMKSLVQEMEDKGISFNRISYNILLNACASTNDIMGMEKFLRKMEADPDVVMGYHPYSIAANGYIKAGDLAKAEKMLKKFEGMIKNGKQKGSAARYKAICAFQVLLTQYASVGRRGEVYHVWSLLKKFPKLHNRSYMRMVSSLVRLDDIDGAERILDEWFARNVSFDIRIPNVLVTAYCKKGEMQKAESVVSLIVEKGEEPDARTWSNMASGYCYNNQIEDAVKMTKNSISKNPQQKPDIPVLAYCLEYLREKGDYKEAEEIIGLLEEGGVFSADFRDRILRYVGKDDPSEQESDSGKEEILEMKFEKSILTFSSLLQQLNVSTLASSSSFILVAG